MTIGLVLTGIWAVITFFLAVTAEEMEILIALAVLIVGGYLLGIYFLFVVAITAKTKKGKWIGFAFFAIWLLIPVINMAIQKLESAWYHHKLETTTPTEEIVREVFKEIDPSYVQLPNDFYSYHNKELTIKIDTLEQLFLEQAQKTYKDILNEVRQEDLEKIDEIMIEDVFSRHLLHVFHLHNGIWSRTNDPMKITVELYYNKEVIYKTVSTDRSHIHGQEMLINKIHQLYQRLKPEIIQEK